MRRKEPWGEAPLPLLGIEGAGGEEGAGKFAHKVARRGGDSHGLSFLCEEIKLLRVRGGVG